MNDVFGMVIITLVFVAGIYFQYLNHRRDMAWAEAVNNLLAERESQRSEEQRIAYAIAEEIYRDPQSVAEMAKQALKDYEEGKTLEFPGEEKK